MGLGDGAVEWDLVLWERLGGCFFVWKVERNIEVGFDRADDGLG